jgi:hypothetical protein
MHICAKAASAAYWSIVSRPARLLFVVSSVAVLKLSEPSFLFRQHCPCARAAVAFRSVCIISPCHHASVRIRVVHSQLRARLSHRAPKGTKKKMAARFHRKKFSSRGNIWNLHIIPPRPSPDMRIHGTLLETVCFQEMHVAPRGRSSATRKMCTKNDCASSPTSAVCPDHSRS